MSDSLSSQPPRDGGERWYKRFCKWMWFDCRRHGAVFHAGRGCCPICESYGWQKRPETAEDRACRLEAALGSFIEAHDFEMFSDEWTCSIEAFEEAEAALVPVPSQVRTG